MSKADSESGRISRRLVLGAIGVSAAAAAAELTHPVAANAATVSFGDGAANAPDFPGPSSPAAVILNADATPPSSNFAPYPPPMPSAQLYSRFTTDDITVDGTLKPAYLAAGAQRISHAKSPDFTKDVTSSTYGVLRSAWDGPVLYLHVEVHDSTPSRGAPTDTGHIQNAANNPAIRDAVVFSLDFWNDKQDKLLDDDGVFTVSSNGNMTYVFDTQIYEFSCVHADPANHEYTDRIKAYAAVDTDYGYNVELALQIEGAELANGTKFGVEVTIGDSPAFGKPVSAYICWSHNDNSYPALDQGNQADWGTVTLAGWDGVTPFKFSDWPLRNALRWLGSISFQRGVWTGATQARLDAATAAANQTLGSGDQEEVDQVTTELLDAIDGLRWADTRYPDPQDLPSLMTLPDPWTYFDGRKVTSKEDWFRPGGRREEILDLAQFYEYGYMPKPPDHMEITAVTPVAADSKVIPPTPAGYSVTASVTYGSTTAPVTFGLFPPTKAVHSGPVPVVMAFSDYFPGFSGYIPAYGDAGYAMLMIPFDVTTDDRNEPWTTRSGIFRTFFPYTRNGPAALNEIGNEMGAAWGVSRGIDALTLLAASGDTWGKGVAAIAAPDKLAVTGLSILGKYAFVAAVFDDRINVCVPNAAGATGPSPWRYLSVGHVYSWGQSNGTETMGDNTRLNEGRANTLFRKFLTPGRFYRQLPGAWGYGDRLPFDQHELAGTLAPRAIVTCDTVNDYGDGSEQDPMGCEAAKFIYTTLGFDAGNLVKFNIRPYNATQPHNEDEPQEQRTAAYLDHYFYGTPIPAGTAAYLNDDPYSDSGQTPDGPSNGVPQNTYNSYFGGWETIAPWKDYKFPTA